MIFILRNVLMVSHDQLSYKQRNLSAPHQTEIVDWLGPPHSFAAWHRPRLEWCWWCCWGNWPMMGRGGEKAKHYVIVFLCFKRLPFMRFFAQIHKFTAYNQVQKIQFLTLSFDVWFLDYRIIIVWTWIPLFFLLFIKQRNRSLLEAA